MNQPYNQQGNFFDGTGDDEGVLDQFEPLPDADYLMVVNSCAVQPSKNNPSVLMYAVEFEVCQGAKQGRKLFTNFTFQHSNVKAVNIGRARMKQLCLSVLGRPTCGQPSELYAKPLTVRTKIKHDPHYGSKHELVKMGPAAGIPEKRAGNGQQTAPQTQTGYQAPLPPAQGQGVAPTAPGQVEGKPEGWVNPPPGAEGHVPF